MLFSKLIALPFLALANAYSIEQALLAVPPSIPTEIEAAAVARSLVNRESLTNVNTLKKIVNTNGFSKEHPVSFMEYYADCDNDGDFYWLIVEASTAYKNIAAGSDFSFSIRAGDHPINDHVNPYYPGGIVNSPAGSPRISLLGTLTNVSFVTPAEKIKLETCFIKKHPDAKAWLPSAIASPHKTHWTKFVVDDIYFIGGFGDRAYIGNIDSKIYHEAKPVDRYYV